ncbi:ATP-binding protein [Lacibacter sediminis]|uniref:ATP-binding protein n=1 Tax=Lacibacter sediminis TaxID=2760713 RepID=A0A7G5XLV9_9BACT|nr:DUF87 domain-containing protein [Lacibacter sediminis]QNA46462.1 ATP-binding protein [Lacibacter sediminis]
MSQGSVTQLLNNTSISGNPIESLRSFLDTEARMEAAKQLDKMRFVGYVLELGYDTAKIITSDPYKLAVGGIPRGSFLIMTPINAGNTPLHFTLLRVNGVSPTPLTMQVQQTYFELHKKSMPELDRWTQSELQWGALSCNVLGMFYANPGDNQKLAFSGDVNNVVSAHRYKVFAPDDELLKLIVDGMVNIDHKYSIGVLRTMECGLFSPGAAGKIPVSISMRDFMGTRTAMFGKTRLGKSNVVKLIAQGLIETTGTKKNVGQIIFDINGEYANDNPQDGNKSIRSAYEDRCKVYALTERAETPSLPLRLNFYEQPDSIIEVIASMLATDNKNANYIKSFASVKLPAISSIVTMEEGDKCRAIRKVQLFWAILKKAGFPADERKLRALGLTSRNAKNFNPSFKADLRTQAYLHQGQNAAPAQPDSLDQLVTEMEVMAQFRRDNGSSPLLKSGSGKDIFDADDVAMLDFLNPNSGSGPSILRSYITYHSPNAGDFLIEILKLIDVGTTVILDLGNATDQIRRYFADMISKEVFGHQEKKFVENKLEDHFIQLYFEEAHNLFPPDGKDLTGVYARFAKEGAKFHVGMIYSTQSPSTINKELLAQTENFFVGHLSSQDETRALSRVQIAFDGSEEDILKAKTPGYMRMLTMSHRFVIPIQANKFEATASVVKPLN